MLPTRLAHTAWPLGDFPFYYNYYFLYNTGKGPRESSKIFELPGTFRFHFLSLKEASLQERMFQVGNIDTTATDLVGKYFHNLLWDVANGLLYVASGLFLLSRLLFSSPKMAFSEIQMKWITFGHVNKNIVS